VIRRSRVKIASGVAFAAAAMIASGVGSLGTAASAASRGPTRGGNLIIARTADSQSMNNTTVFDNESIWVFEQIFQTLYTVSGDGKSVVPQLATGYTMSADKKTYTFKLRPGVRFSTGQLMTSADVKFSLDQARAASQGWGYIDTAIQEVDAPAPSTVVIKLNTPWAPLLADLSLFANGIVPANYSGQTEDQFYQHPVSTGPFKWDFWHKGQALKLTRNTFYWQKGLPYLNSVEWTDTPNDNTRLLQLKGNQAQVDEFPAFATLNSLQTAQGVHLNLFNSTRTDYLAFNEQRKPFQDTHVRRAISLALDRSAMVRAVLFGHGKPANDFFPPQVPFYQKSTPGLQFNLNAAKKEMAKSSVPSGFSTTLLVPAGNSDYNTVGQIVQSELAPLGIKVTIQQLDQNTVTTNQQNLNYDMVFTYWTMDIPDPDELVTFAVDPTSGAKSFYTAYNNPAVVSAAHQAEQVSNPATRQQLYNQIQNQSASDAFMANLYYSPYAYATRSAVHGFNVTPLGNYHLENVWIGR
jgi:peptide/nickel transport system substrate-binding protein